MKNSASKIGLSEAAKEKQREYHRKWRRENAEKVKTYQRSYWERRALETK